MDTQNDYSKLLNSLYQTILVQLKSTHILLIVGIYLSAALFFIIKALAQDSIYVVIFMILIGMSLWTLMEYGTHRFLFHGKSKSKKLMKLQYFIHGYHHVYPMDTTRYVVPLAVTFPVTVLFYVFYKFIFGTNEAVFAGFLIGYLLYDGCHYTIHCFRPKTRVGKFLKTHHFFHHFKASHLCFGVTNPLWDHVFNTTMGNASFTQSLKKNDIK